jgi:hypothetical protein
MNIYIDESGSFVSAPSLNAWNAVGALVVPESARRGLERALSLVKARNDCSTSAELKINGISEKTYLQFVTQLRDLGVLLVSTATDAGLNSAELLEHHKAVQAEKVLRHVDKMVYESGKAALRDTAARILRLSPQLYVQLHCQIGLMYDVVNKATNYYAQRIPATLSTFRWRFDRKNIQKNNFEESFERLGPVILQTLSLERPFLRVKEFDYSKMTHFEWSEGKAPRYLEEEYGIEVRGSSLNIGKILGENIAFVDSRATRGIQAIDLLVSGIRKCLRQAFSDNGAVAAALGSLMIEGIPPEICIRLVHFGVAEDVPAQGGADEIINEMKRHARPMLKEP